MNNDFEIRDGVVYITKNGQRRKADWQQDAQKEAAIKLLKKKRK